VRSTARSKIAVLVGSIIAMSTLAACAGGGDPAPTAFGTAETPYVSTQASEVFSGIDFDYEPVASPAALAGQSELVITGTIDRVQEGRVQVVPGNDAVPEISTIVLVLQDVVVASGALHGGSDGFIYVELPNPGNQKPLEYEDGLRAGSRVVAYLVPASDGAPAEGIDIAVADPGSGRPAGQVLFLPAGPQGLLVQYENEGIVWPLIGEQRRGKLVDALPGGDLIAP
jgi:hypothetical protein